ncbi:hypothetical protein LOTGIDRAFT_236788 [Lottia gigantea]|uniref:PX domain-containing protein n=1 Tax=Lottia gigantea TaxID=225164 RepID=V3ZGB5_LOTGI|nr:hypothetical protein LOTGIDRAFT_236788 [Lottia gigantea]ESO83197.1 hypothetical protein LOTGIDRAFT_236788 [Lottia gigantea]
MPAATVTVRELKNKESGLDISIPNYKEIPGLLGGTVEYNVVVVSNLFYFKSPKHKESDVVQFMISKKYGELEDFYKRLNDKFSGTAFPPLPKKAFLMSETVIRERRASLEHFLKFIAVVPKIVTSPLFLEFLGVNALKAGKVKSGDEKAEKEKNETETEETEQEDKPGDVFDEEEGDQELFAEEEQEDEELFKGSSSQSRDTEQTPMYEEPDLGGGIDEDEGQDLFLPEAVVKSEVKLTTSAEDTEYSELLRIEDDLEELLQLKPKKSVEKQTEIPEKTRPIPVPRKLKPQTPSKPSIPTKPKPDSARPALPDKKPKPTLPSKPKPTAKEDNSAVTDSNIPKDNVETDLSNDDIMKYITENSSADADLELF